MNKNKIWDTVIIGCGPAGITAGIYAARAQLSVAIIEKSAPGGKVLLTSDIENYTGYKLITGPDLAYQMYEQITTLPVEYIANEVVAIKKNKNIFEIQLLDKTTINAKTVIAATGTKERLIGVPGEVEFYGKGVSYCAVCDAALHKNEIIVVVGGGNAALEEAIYLTKFAKKVYVIHRRQGFRASKIVIDKAKNNPKIEFILDAVLDGIYGKNEVQHITYKNLITNKIHKIETRIVFPLIGAIPVTNYLEEWKILDDNKYVIVNSEMMTKTPGLFSVGDINAKPLRQIVTAVGDGGIAGQFVVHYLDNHDL